MSGAGEEHRRNAQGPTTQTPPNQLPKQSASRKASYSARVQGQNFIDREEGSRAMSSDNAWASTRGKGNGQSATAGQQASAGGFKAQETRDLLRRGLKSVSGDNVKALPYKPPPIQAGTKSGGPWASKPNTMGSGKDFFLELRKQISALQHSERVGG
ncbi:hypothetical protein MMC19_002014 [Ptychographa xylographoides]|nr:hypothetical protein [Ptychographa xylographoides]